MMSNPSPASSPTNTELLDLYKLHSEFADRVSARREGANRLYVSLLLGLAATVGLLVRLGGLEDATTGIVLTVLNLFGALLAVSWYIVIRSYRQLNTGKFAALLELEKQLAYPFFRREWELLREGRDYRAYWRLTVVETSLPALFFVLFVGLAVFVR